MYIRLFQCTPKINEHPKKTFFQVSETQMK